MIEKKIGNDGGVYYVVADHINVWVSESNSIHFKTNDPHGDPVELGEIEAKHLIQLLKALIYEIQ